MASRLPAAGSNWGARSSWNAQARRNDFRIINYLRSSLDCAEPASEGLRPTHRGIGCKDNCVAEVALVKPRYA